MTWQLATMFSMGFAIIGVTLVKEVTNRLQYRSVGLFYQYVVALTAAASYALIAQEWWSVPTFGLPLLFSTGLGLLTVIGTYFQWYAYKVSLSKTSVFMPLQDVLAISLAMVFLQEFNLLNSRIIFGVLFCLIAMWLFSWHNGNGQKAGLKWLVATLIMVTLHGSGSFLMKVFSFTIPNSVFVLGWYAGSFIGTWPMLLFEQPKSLAVSKLTAFRIVLLGICIVAALATKFWSFQLGGLVTTVSPIRNTFLTMMPILIGWLFFKEVKQLSGKEKLGFAIGLIGATLLLFSS